MQGRLAHPLTCALTAKEVLASTNPTEGSDEPSNRGKSLFEYMETNGSVPPVPLVVRGPWARESGDP